MSKDTQTITLDNFDLDAFIAGATPETRYVDVYPDQKLMGRTRQVKQKLIKAINDAELLDPPSTMGLGDKTEVDVLRAEYEALLSQCETQVLTVEVQGLGKERREELTQDFLAKKQIKKAKLKNNADLQLQLDKWVMPHAIVYPKLTSYEEVERFANAIGDVQWQLVMNGFAECILTRTSMEDLSPDFLHKSSSEDDGDDS